MRLRRFLLSLTAGAAGLLPAMLLLAMPAQAQPEPLAFGKPDLADLTAAPFAHDSAAAVVLCDYGTASIVGDDPTHRTIRFDRTTRIKILTKAGLDWANVEVRLRHEFAGRNERLFNLRGYTYNLVNGKLVAVPLDKASSFLNPVSKLYSVQKFALPQVREGSVIEYSYTIFSDYLLNFRSWQFQYPIPVRWSEFRAAMPYQFTYKIFVQHTQPLAVEEQTGAQSVEPRFRWAMRDVPALHQEPFMAAPTDYRDELFFELANYYHHDVTRSWGQIDDYLFHDPDFGQQLDQTGFLKADVAVLPAATATNDAARLAAVRDLITKRVLCTGEPRLTTSASLRKIYLETHRGTVADVNLLFVMALRTAGFVANPVLLSTRGYGRVRATLPMLSQFNYVAAHVRLPDEQELVLDATNPQLPYDMLPGRCLNQQGRLLLAPPDSSRWLTLLPRHRATHLQRVALQLSATGAVSGQVHEEYAGYAGAAARAELTELGTAKYAARLANQHTDWAVSGLAIAQRDSVQRPLGLDYAVVRAAESGTALTTIYLSPLQSFGLRRNPLRADTRLYPIDFGFAQEDILQLVLTLPDGYELAELPKSQSLDLPDNGGRFSTAAAVNGHKVEFTSRLVLRKPVYAAAEYGALRALYQRVLEKQAEKLVLRKKA